MLHSNDDISPFVPFFDIAVSLGNLFQRIASIYDRYQQVYGIRLLIVHIEVLWLLRSAWEPLAGALRPLRIGSILDRQGQWSYTVFRIRLCGVLPIVLYPDSAPPAEVAD